MKNGQRLVAALIGDKQEKEYTYGTPGSPSDFDGLTITVRPSGPTRTYEFLNSDEKFLDRAAKLIEKQLVAWNVASGSDPELVAAKDAVTIRALPYVLQSWMVNCIIGYNLSNKSNAPSEVSEATSDAKNSLGP